VALLESRNRKTRLGIIPCTNSVFPRLIEIPTRPGTFMLSEELILHFLSKLYRSYTVREKSVMRVTRSADLDSVAAYDEDLDYRDNMEHLIQRRSRLSPVRLELTRSMGRKVRQTLAGYLGLDVTHVFQATTPLDLSYVSQLQDFLRTDRSLFYPKRSPRTTPSLDRKKSILAQIEQKDVLLSYPFESMRPFLDLLHEAAEDESVVSIKMTLYRVASRSKVVEALIDAAENGKEVMVLMELRARFDEANNIEMSHRLEDAGCRVIYGLPEYKVHSKLCLITRNTGAGHSYVTQIGTGNYNEKTAQQYTDLSLLTADPRIGAEAARIFTALACGETVEDCQHLLVAPHGLQNRILDLIQGEIDKALVGQDAYIGVKINSLTDRDIIKALIRASKAGVKVELIVRGICCLRPKVPDKTDNITVISVVGRFLEHSRIYRFGVGDEEQIYIASADFMTRNTLRRVEVAAPIYDPALKERLRHIFDTVLRDDEKGKEQLADGSYVDRHLNEPPLNSQELFYEEAYRAARK
jgi:polyphosphate kinase